MEALQVRQALPPDLAAAYETVSVLKKSANGCTLLLRHRESGKQAVLKTARDGPLLADGMAEALRPLEGKGIPVMLAYGSWNGTNYLLRESVEGETLLELCRDKGPLTPRETCAIGAQICSILESLHQLDPPVIHRDIKAENIVRTPEGQCVLIDFGIARFYREAKEACRDTQVSGTQFAAAPEQFGYAQTDPRSDIYSLGVLLHELATGKTDLREGKLPSDLQRVVNRCTRFDPQDRYPSAAAAGNALRRCLRWKRYAAGIAAMLVLLVPLLLFLWGGAVSPEGTSDIPEEPYEFASPEIGREVARQLGKDVSAVTREDLEGITSLMLIGDTPVSNWDDIIIYGESITLGFPDMEDTSNDYTDVRGTIQNLQDIAAMPNLTELALCNQQIADLTPLVGLRLTRLALHGNEITDLMPISTCRDLLELYISANPVENLSPLKQLPNLWRLNAGATKIWDLETLRGTNISRLEVVDCPNFLHLSGVEDMPALNHLFLRPAREEDLQRIGQIQTLKALTIWSDVPLQDLTVFSGLTQLGYLYLADGAVYSLDGVENLPNLFWLEVRSDNPLSVAPAAGLNALEILACGHLTSDTGWSELATLPALKRIQVPAEDVPAVEAVLAGRDVTVEPA